MTTFVLTVLGGVLIFVFGQIALRVWIEPIQDLRTTIGEVAYVLFYYANVYANPTPERPNQLNEKAEDELRQKAALLFSQFNGILCYNFFASLRLVPQTQEVIVAVQELTFLSNNVRSGTPKENREAREKIEKALGLSLRP